MNTPQLPLELLDRIVDIVDSWNYNDRLTTLQACALVSWPLLISCRRRLLRVTLFELGGEPSLQHNMFVDKSIPTFLDFLEGDPCLSYRRRTRGYPRLSSNIRKLHITIGPAPIAQVTFTYLSTILSRLDHVEALYFQSTNNLSISESGLLSGLLDLFKTSSPLKLVSFNKGFRVPIQLLLSCPSLRQLWLHKMNDPATDILQPFLQFSAGSIPRLQQLDIDLASLDILASYLYHPRGTQMFSHLEELTTKDIDATRHTLGSLYKLLRIASNTLHTLHFNFMLGYGDPNSNLQMTTSLPPSQKLDLSTLPNLKSIHVDINDHEPLSIACFTLFHSLISQAAYPTTVQHISFILEAPIHPHEETFQQLHSLLFDEAKEEWAELDTLLCGSGSGSQSQTQTPAPCNYPSLETFHLEINIDMTPYSEDELPWEESAVDVELQLKKSFAQSLPKCSSKGVLDIAVFLILEDLDDESVDTNDWDAVDREEL
ncbi:hypothetical protein CPB83DRAFT_862830 [Crepidotus variabilis]|uniref:Uncharacterized protein n=1 Tax=Crepidotus variabilis TaxID=179855 RepID=A0A9P6JJN6_9AGAR|nr:hypothetical protein CPB83DRAFT_862830 [Crepidotus variabilis]